jgi:chemotaxis protein CheZ
MNDIKANADLDVDTLKGELIGLFQYVNRVRYEIAAINHPVEDEHVLSSMADQLDAIVEATEHATNTIMESVEQSTELLYSIRDDLTDEQKAVVDKSIEWSNQVFEACSFQDITGQRVSKVMKSIIYVEERVNALIDVWGKDELDKVNVQATLEKTSDEKLLNGPQLKGQGISQNEIDSLFD